MKKSLFLAISLILSLDAQNLKMSVTEIISTNPIILERQKNYNLTKEDITTAKAGYYPKLDLKIGIGLEKHDGTLADGSNRYAGRDSFNVYQNSLKYTQNIFKGFETTNQVAAQEFRTLSSAYSYIEKVNDTSFEMVNTYLQVMRNTELLATAKANVEINKKIFEKVQKLYDSGLTTLSEVNKVESSLSLAKSNFIVQENTLLDVTYNMQRVLGRYLDPQTMSRPTLNTSFPDTHEEAAQFAIHNNPSLIISQYNIKLAQSKYKESKSSLYPHLDIEISQSMNKNLSALEGEDNPFRAMAYLSYNIFNGFSDKADIQKNISTIHQEVETKNILRRKVIEGLNLSWAANTKLTEQLIYLKEYKKFAKKTLTLYVKEYDLGRRSLLDLLSAQNDFIGAKSQIINTEYSILFAKYRILDAMGTLVPTIIGNTDLIYSNVGLKGQVPKNKDSLPIYFDKDNDLIVDEQDLCNNSLANDMRDIYGCKFTDNETKKIERYRGFTFQTKSDLLNENGTTRLNALIKQISPYGFSKIKFTLLGNAQDNSFSDIELLELSKKRALKIKKLLIKAGALEANIIILAESNKSPLYSDEDSETIAKNNRVDIVVRKIN